MLNKALANHAPEFDRYLSKVLRAYARQSSAETMLAEAKADAHRLKVARECRDMLSIIQESERLSRAPYANDPEAQRLCWRWAQEQEAYRLAVAPIHNNWMEATPAEIQRKEALDEELNDQREAFRDGMERVKERLTGKSQLAKPAACTPLSSKDGPNPPDEFWWRGKMHRVERKPCELIATIWETSKIEVAELEEKVWGDEAESDSRLKAALNKANDVLLQAGYPKQIRKRGKWLKLE